MPQLGIGSLASWCAEHNAPQQVHSVAASSFGTGTTAAYSLATGKASDRRDLLIGFFCVYTLAASSILVGNRPALRSAPAPRHPAYVATYALSVHVALRSRFPRLLRSLLLYTTPPPVPRHISGVALIP
ncbi:hypothetical protein K438DRAFT_1772168 [Mycena galopus ATCC 62051]|nr:hypothetical protein K438DRAFT_1772168 [Mycena galopus ATCC 62051]